MTLPGRTQGKAAGDVGADGDKLPVGTFIGEFEITGLVGEGGFSVVYLAWDHSLERKVALKEYMPASLAVRASPSQVQPRSERQRETFTLGLRSFINEAKLLAQFDHPALVKVYRFWEANGTAYMVMPFYEGTTLKDAVRALGQPPDEAWLRRVLLPLTEALLVIHQDQCFHRDIAPDNVLLLSQGGKPLLLDFGAARRVVGDKTQALTVILKPGYAPIEQYADDVSLKQGPWTDVYALAAVIYWCITGKTPPIAVGRMLQDGYVPLAKSAAGQYGAGFLSAVDRALAVLPEARTQSIAHFRTELGLGVAPPTAEDDKTVLWADPEATVMGKAATAAPSTFGPSTSGAALLIAADSPVPSSRRDPEPQAAVASSRAAATPPPTAGKSGGRGGVRLTLGAVAAILAAGGAWWAIEGSSVKTPAGASTAISAPAPSTGPPTASSAPAAAPEAPTAAAAPLTADVVLDRLLTQRDPRLEVSSTSTLVSKGAAGDTVRITFKGSAPGHVYVVALRPAQARLSLLHPLPGAPVVRAAANGSLDLPLTASRLAALDDTRLFLVLSRERRDPAGARWQEQEGLWSRVFESSADLDGIGGNPLGPPRCERASVACPPNFGVTEVMRMTNVTPAPSPAKEPVASSSETREAASRPASTSGTQRRDSGPVSEGTRPSSRPNANAAECAQILQRVSLGEASPELIERLKTLGCR